MSTEIKYKIANGQARPTEAMAIGRAMKNRDRKPDQFSKDKLNQPQVDSVDGLEIQKQEIPTMVEKIHTQLKFNQIESAVLTLSESLTKREKEWIQQSFNDLKVSITFITSENTTQIKIER